MKRIVSVSLGSKKRDGKLTASYGGQQFSIERIGTDGDKKKAVELIRELDGEVDAIGLGGTDLYIYAGNKRYTFRETQEIAAAAKITPVVDGSGIKNTLERRVVKYISDKCDIELKDKQVLVVCAVDRFGLAEALVEAGCRVVFGDLLYGLGLPMPIRSLATLNQVARLVAPVITKLPIAMFYPTGKKQHQRSTKFQKYFYQADVIAGDFHFINRYMPEELSGKTIITNTVTTEDEVVLQKRGVATLVTTTPEMAGRSFGTNILEAILITLAGKEPGNITVNDYSRILDDIGIEPRVKCL